MDVPLRPSTNAGFSAVELLVAVAILGSIAAMALPISGNMIDDVRLRGDGQGLSSSIALAKMTGAARFTRARVRMDQAAGTYQVETWQTTGAPGWVMDGGRQQLSVRGQFGAGPAALPPPNSQAAVAQPAPCLDNAGDPIAGTSCVLFNSRGLPITSAGVPTTTQVMYLRGPTGVFAIVIGAAGQMQVWRTTLNASGTWRQQ